jgi:hypothetical protein
VLEGVAERSEEAAEVGGTKPEHCACALSGGVPGGSALVGGGKGEGGGLGGEGGGGDGSGGEGGFGGGGGGDKVAKVERLVALTLESASSSESAVSIVSGGTRAKSRARVDRARELCARRLKGR